MGPKRNCFQLEAGQVKIKSIAELKTFHISCVRVRWCSLFFFFFFPFSLLVVLLRRRSNAKRTLELVVSLFWARNFFDGYSTTSDWGRTEPWKKKKRNDGSNFILQSIDSGIFMFPLQILLFAAHQVKFFIVYFDHGTQKWRRKMYTIIYERNVTILKSVLLLFDIRPIKDELDDEAAMLQFISDDKQWHTTHQRYQSLDSTYFDWQHETIAWNRKLVSQKYSGPRKFN